MKVNVNVGGTGSGGGIGGGLSKAMADSLYHPLKGKANLDILVKGVKFAPQTSASTPENPAEHLEVVTISGKQYLHTPLPFYSDQSVASGAPGSGGGGGGGGSTVYWGSYDAINKYISLYVNNSEEESDPKIVALRGHTHSFNDQWLVNAATQIAGDVESYVGLNYVPNGREVTAGTGLSGGGALTSDISLSIESNTLTKINNGDAAYTLLNTLFTVHRNESTQAIESIESNYGFWSQYYISSGASSQAGGGGGGGGGSTVYWIADQSYPAYNQSTDVRLGNLSIDDEPNYIYLSKSGIASMLGLGAAAYMTVGAVSSGNTGLVTGGDVYTAIHSVTNDMFVEYVIDSTHTALKLNPNKYCGLMAEGFIVSGTPSSQSSGGGGGTAVSWGPETNGWAQLIIDDELTHKTVALSGHEHTTSTVTHSGLYLNTLIPSQVTSTNILADKDFVNSSISTATATFRGSYNSVTDLSLTTSATREQIAAAIATKLASLVPPIVPDNNDYVFVAIPTADATPTQIARVERYKYVVPAAPATPYWAYEYTLNNSGFTAAQWASINSGLTSSYKTKIDNYANTGSYNLPIYFDGNSAAQTITHLSVPNSVSAGSYVNATTDITAGQKYYVGTSATASLKFSNGQYLTWDGTANSWHLVGNLYVDGFVSSGAASDDQSGSTAVEWDSIYQSGIQIATITIDNVEQDVYIPSSQPSNPNLTAISSITGAGLLRRNNDDSWTLDSNTYLTSHQTIYGLTINDSSGTKQLSYTPNSAQGSLTLSKAMVGLSNVENTALSSWIGSTNITTLGTITTGTWHGTDIDNTYLQGDGALTIGTTSISLGGGSTTLAGLSKVTSTAFWLTNGYVSEGGPESTLTWDSNVNAWKLVGNFYATGSISSGVPSGNQGGGGGVSYLSDLSDVSTDAIGDLTVGQVLSVGEVSGEKKWVATNITIPTYSVVTNSTNGLAFSYAPGNKQSANLESHTYNYLAVDDTNSLKWYSLPFATLSTGGLMTKAAFTKLDGIAENANNYILPKANASTLGGVKIGSTLSINNSTGELNYDLPLAHSDYRGGIRIGYSRPSGTQKYPVEVSLGEKAYVEVPWTDTTYTYSTGLSLTGSSSPYTVSLKAASGNEIGGVKLVQRGHNGLPVYFDGTNPDVKTIDYLNVGTEQGSIILPFFTNDLAFLHNRGGRCEISSGTGSPDLTKLFNGKPDYAYLTLGNASQEVTITIYVPTADSSYYRWGQRFYIDFGQESWIAHNITVQAFDANGTALQNTPITVSNLTTPFWNAGSLQAAGDDGNKSIYKIVVKLSNWETANPRISEIGLQSYDSMGLSAAYMSRGDEDLLHRGLSAYSEYTLKYKGIASTNVATTPAPTAFVVYMGTANTIYDTSSGTSRPTKYPVQLEDGTIYYQKNGDVVKYTSGGDTLYYRWNGNTWIQYNNPSTVPNYNAQEGDIVKYYSSSEWKYYRCTKHVSGNSTTYTWDLITAYTVEYMQNTSQYSIGNSSAYWSGVYTKALYLGAYGGNIWAKDGDDPVLSVWGGAQDNYGDIAIGHASATAKRNIDLYARDTVSVAFACSSKCKFTAAGFSPYTNGGYKLGASDVLFSELHASKWYPVANDNNNYVEYASGAFYFHGNIVATGNITAGAAGATADDYITISGIDDSSLSSEDITTLNNNVNAIMAGNVTRIAKNSDCWYAITYALKSGSNYTITFMKPNGDIGNFRKVNGSWTIQIS